MKKKYIVLVYSVGDVLLISIIAQSCKLWSCPTNALATLTTNTILIREAFNYAISITTKNMLWLSNTLYHLYSVLDAIFHYGGN